MADDSNDLLAQAARCRRLAAGVLDSQTQRALLDMACEYEARAKLLEAKLPPE